MGENTYPASTAIRLVAVGRMQRRAEHAKNLFVEDRLLRATDAIVGRRRDDRNHPDLPDRIAERDIASAVEATERDADGLVLRLVVAGENLIARAIENTRRTVRRRHDVHCAMPPHELSGRERRTEADDWLDFASLAQHAPRFQREALLRRARGQDDQEIAAALKIKEKYVPVLVHRGIASMRSMMAHELIRPLQPAV